jgi:hypothetical protein
VAGFVYIDRSEFHELFAKDVSATEARRSLDLYDRFLAISSLVFEVCPAALPSPGDDLVGRREPAQRNGKLREKLFHEMQ